jgi:hypothetical protein
MTIYEPSTLVTDAVLAAVAAALGARLFAASRSPSRRATRLWAGAFLAGAVAALAGAIVHGFGPSLAPALKASLWKLVLVGAGLACALLLAGSSVAALGGRTRRACLGVGAGLLAVYLTLVARSNDIRLAAGYGVLTIVALLGLGLATARHDRRSLATLVGALALSAAGIAVQQAHLVGLGPFNHNDLCHLLEIAALWPFYRVGLGFRDRPA